MRLQYIQIHKMDWDVLIILDAMRFDVFKEITGEGEPVWSAGSCTDEWLTNTWPHKYPITYIAGNPFVSMYKGHFRRVIDAWKEGWRCIRGCWTVPPEEIIKAYIAWRDAGGKGKVVLHFMQPHLPSIGRIALPKSSSKQVPGYDPYKIALQEYGPEMVREAYYSNAEFIIKRVFKFIDKIEGKVVITSDHGDLLGEDGMWGHGKIPHSILRTVPWLEMVV